MRIAVAAQHAGVFAPFHAAVYPAFWSNGLDLGSADVIAEVLAGAGLDPAALAERAEARLTSRTRRESSFYSLCSIARELGDRAPADLTARSRDAIRRAFRARLG